MMKTGASEGRTTTPTNRTGQDRTNERQSRGKAEARRKQSEHVGGEISRYTQSTTSATRRVQGAEPVTGDTAEDDGLPALPVLWDGRGWPRRACSPDAPMAKPSSRTAWPREEARGSGPSLHFWTGGGVQDCRVRFCWRVNATGVFKRLSSPAAQHIRLVPGLPASRSPASIPQLRAL
jgi:hypothetical protein